MRISLRRMMSQRLRSHLSNFRPSPFLFKMGKESLLDSVKAYLSGFGKLGVREKRILESMEKVDRSKFVAKKFKEKIYIDTALPIEKGQTISQPSTVARMLQLLELKKGDNVLEIGTGSGWNASLIAFLVKPGKVTTTEIHKELKDKASNRLKKLGIKNVKVISKDFRKIKEKFDKIIFTAGVSEKQTDIVEDFAKSNLNKEGILICPYRYGPLIIIKKQKKQKGKEKIKKIHSKEEYVFVPLLD